MDISEAVKRKLISYDRFTVTYHWPAKLLMYYTPHRTLRSANQHLLQQSPFSTEFDKVF